MPRTEIHSKLERQIQAIELVAQANERVAVVLERGEVDIPDEVVKLAKGLMALCGDTTQQSDIIARLRDAEGEAFEAFNKLGFVEVNLQELYCVICTNPNVGCTSGPTPPPATRTTPPEPKSPPPTSPPRGKVAAKKR